MEFTRDTFADVTGSNFTLTADGGHSIEIRLDEVSELKERTRQQSFSLVFIVPEGYRVEQGLYDLNHEKLGDLQLFLVPIGTGKAGQELEAVFNLIKKNG